MVQQGKKGNDLPNGGNKYRDQQSNMASQRRDMGDSRGSGRMGFNDARSQNGNSSFFRTDSAISGGRIQGERPLQRWVPDRPEEIDGSLESAGASKGASVKWDQFAENERRFGTKTDYDENIYTTRIDKSHPMYQRRVADAARIAQEIEGSQPMNSHVAEERIADHVGANENGIDEEDKYSGVRRQDFPPLTSSKDKYQPPGKRGAQVDPAIIISRLAPADKPVEKPVEKVKAATSGKPSKPEVATPPTTTESSIAPTPEVKPEVKATPSSSRTESPQVKAAAGPNATATVENDVAKAFKHFAANERVSINHSLNQRRITKAKNDKAAKLTDLKRFANEFKLHTPVPSDLVPIIAKDPAKQKEIQEKAKRNAEEAKLTESAKPITPSSETSSSQRSVATVTAHNASPSGVPGRQQPGRNPYPQGANSFTQNSRGERPQSSMPLQQSRTTGNLSARLRTIEQNRSSQVPSNAITVNEARLPPTGPSNPVDPNFSRRSSGVASAQGGPRLNPTSNEFRPSPFAKDFSPNGNPSSGSSPRSMVNAPEIQQTPPVTRSLLRRKPLVKDRPIFKGYDAMEYTKTLKPSEGKNWTANGNMKPAYDNPILYKQPLNDEVSETYVQVFEKEPFPPKLPAQSEPHQPHTAPQVAHQHQLPFHLQQGVHNIGARQSPRQPLINMHTAQMGHVPNPAFSGPDELRMMTSHSSQSFSSPRMPQVPLTFPSPMGTNAQLAYNPQMIPFNGGAPMPFRSMSQHQQPFMPQQAHMGGQPIMMPNPAPGFLPAQGMAPNPQMMYPPGSGQFMPPNNGHLPPMQNGYPSPGRGAPMMMNQGSQQGHQQQMYGMSPGPQYSNVVPAFAQPMPNQMPIRGGYAPNQFGANPQQPLHQYGPNRNNGHSNGNYNNKNFQQHNQHSHGAPNNQIPTGPQSQSNGGADESK